MRNITLLVLSVFCGISVSRASDLSTLEGLVEQWVGMRREIATEQQTWKRQEVQWRQEIALLEQESRKLDELLMREELFAVEKDNQTAGQLERKAELIATIDEVGKLVDRTSVIPSTISQWIPAPIQSENLLHYCDKTENSGVDIPVTRRLQNLVSALSEIEALKHSSYIVRQLITIEDDVRREMDVIYLGLASVYAVSPDNSVAAIGSPAPTGWKWTKTPNIASDIRKLISIKRQELPPEIVNIPINGDVVGLPEGLVILPISGTIGESE